jgi:hypothetical protein
LFVARVARAPTLVAPSPRTARIAIPLAFAPFAPCR